MTGDEKNIEGQYFPVFHCGWGSCAEELFYYTSRYYFYTEAFIRNLTDDRSFSMCGYNATHLSHEQRFLMAAVLSCKPRKKSATTIAEIVNSVSLGKSFVNRAHMDQYRKYLAFIPKGASLIFRRNMNCPKIDTLYPLDPFLNITERLRIPVAIRDHHIEVALTDLVKYLDSPVSSIRTNLQNAVLQVHRADYYLRNHPGLTHKEAKAINDARSTPVNAPSVNSI